MSVNCPHSWLLSAGLASAECVSFPAESSWDRSSSKMTVRLGFAEASPYTMIICNHQGRRSDRAAGGRVEDLRTGRWAAQHSSGLSAVTATAGPYSLVRQQLELFWASSKS